MQKSYDFGWLERQVDEHPYPIFFAVLSGAHMYGFPSGDSDYDVRGAHVLPLEDVVGLRARRDTVDVMHDLEGRELDVVTHDLKKFIELLLNKNAMVLEQVFSPHLIEGGDAFDELKEIAGDCITRHHAHHYLGFARSRWEGFEESRRLKALLYAYRGCFSGIHLMRTGEVETDLTTLAAKYNRPDLLDLIEAKQAGTEKMQLDPSSIDKHRDYVLELIERLEKEHEASELRETPEADAKERLHDLLVRVRLQAR
ncbi:nucleotidyltransferase [Persicimonas caeni]|uniref:Nucleotidyltransferase n=1 Tax=Persicimonas caeni TaxID=2292766 RepID=A0A4Y6PQZ9_PERCE|nr:nucleotidyltransferase domain-containing protein [Persicimonas caeni]QDG50751.1 nucleotidyltransferase [Persicimonas caeni]QED31972.1 nucleotidyltransferase [Persicimonas caeni]